MTPTRALAVAAFRHELAELLAEEACCAACAAAVRVRDLGLLVPPACEHHAAMRRLLTLASDLA